MQMAAPPTADARVQIALRQPTFIELHEFIQKQQHKNSSFASNHFSSATMARLTQAPMTPRWSVSNPDSLTDLNRLLARLQQSLLLANVERERRLRTSEYERNKVSINLEYARTLLTTLEQDALAVKVHVRRQEMVADLNHKREIFEQLVERLRELDEISIDSNEDDSSEGEDLLEGIVRTPSESQDSRCVPEREEEESEKEEEEEDKPTEIAEPRQTTQAATTNQSPAAARPSPTEGGTSTTQTLRSRVPENMAEAHQSDTVATSARAQLFGSGPGLSPGQGKCKATTSIDRTATQEAILDHHRAEQDKLTESLLHMAKALKDSSRAFGAELESEKDMLHATGTGLERNERGMDAATRRLDTLHKMTEGEGWWGRMMLWAWAYGLMVMLILIMFVLPKLRL